MTSGEKVATRFALPRELPEAPYVGQFVLQVRPERREDFFAAMETTMTLSAQEEGVLDFTMLVDREDPNRFVLTDVFADAAAFEAHMAADHTTRMLEAINDCLVKPAQGAFYHRLASRSDFH